MSKIICDICGTSYPDTAECCPICGCTNDATGSLFEEDLLTENAGSGAEMKGFSQKRKEIFDFDEVNSPGYEEEPEMYAETVYDEDEEEEEEDEPRQNTFVVILLTVLIALLLMAAGFIFVRYFLPNMGGKEQTQVTEYTEAVAVETTSQSIPCAELYIISGKTVELNAEGQMFLLHVKASPENTTDKIIYTSADPAVATVSEDGKITAVSEGETTVYISCGLTSMECPVIVKYTEVETVAPTVEVVETVAIGENPPAAVEETQAPAGVQTETQPQVVEETTPPTQAPLKNVTLKLKKTDIRLGVYYEFKLLLDCALEQNEVQWSSEHPYIATVDENGVVKAIKSGTTAIVAQYGDQKVQCIVRCS